jgi:hypothetical protein
LTGVVEADLLDPELWCIDVSVVRAARCAGGGGKKGIRTNPKITLEDVLVAAFRRQFTWCAMGTGFRFSFV